MPERSQVDRLDELVQLMLDGQAATPDPELAPLIELARDLRDLPRESFKASLKSELERKTTMVTATESLRAIRQTASPRLRVKNAGAAIEFYKKAFGARETMRFDVGGKVAHAALAIGDSQILLGEEAIEYGYPGPETLGGSPVTIQLQVDDVDSFAAQAVAAGAKMVLPIQDHFYGERGGTVADPFGYSWSISTRKEDLSVEEMHQRFDAMMKQQAASRTAASYVPAGFHTLTPYLRVQDVPAQIAFLTTVFGAEQTFHTIGSAGGIHAEVRVGDSMLMVGGGAPNLAWRGDSRPAALHVYVDDVDAVYQRALDAGAESLHAPEDQPYGERGGSVRDRSGNSWYLATYKGAVHVPEGFRMVTPYLHPLRAEPVIGFLTRAFGAQGVEKYASPDGVIHHAKLTIGDSVLEMGEAHGIYQPVQSMFYMYVPDVDATYHRALVAGATSISAPADQPYGDRSAGVKDSFGNEWYIATHIQDVG